MKNYYAILEVPNGCSPEEIRQSYRRLVQEHLDDTALFADLREAYEVLSTPARRAEYDQTWGAALEAPFAAAGPAHAGRCPMGAEGQCPVLQGRAPVTDTYCAECGYLLAGLSSSTTFEAEALSSAKHPWLEDAAGKMHPPRPGSNSVGREGGDVLVPDKTVSRSHARLELADDGALTVEDLGSTNGTRVNDEALTPQVSRLLADGDTLRFGSVYFTLRLSTPDSADTSALLATSSEPAPPVAEARAQVVETREGMTAAYPLAPGLTTFGRRPENTVVISGDLYVSGSHAQISADGEVFILTDTGSTNGTLLNGERIPINTPFTLDAGDEILIGGTSLRFERLEQNAETEDARIEEAQIAEPNTEEPNTEDAQIESSPEHAEG